MKKRSFRRDCSGQVIVITALLVALVLLSTAIYVIETEKGVPSAAADTNNIFPAYQQATRNTLISALANITNGGNPSILTIDLNQLCSAITSHSYQALLQANFTPMNEAPYQNGVWVSWGTNGKGTSSASVTLTINSAGTSSTSNLQYLVNVTSQITLSGSSLQLNDTLDQVTLNVHLTNDGKPALAQNLTFFYRDSIYIGNWTQATDPKITDFGDGTYTATFNAQIQQPGDPIDASAYCIDQRGILTCANVTCTT